MYVQIEISSTGATGTDSTIEKCFPRNWEGQNRPEKCFPRNWEGQNQPTLNVYKVINSSYF
jgi:hypothetical protein